MTLLGAALREPDESDVFLLQHDDRCRVSGHPLLRGAQHPGGSSQSVVRMLDALLCCRAPEVASARRVAERCMVLFFIVSHRERCSLGGWRLQ